MQLICGCLCAMVEDQMLVMMMTLGMMMMMMMMRTVGTIILFVLTGLLTKVRGIGGAQCASTTVASKVHGSNAGTARKHNCCQQGTRLQR